MSVEQGIKLRHGRVIDFSVEGDTSTDLVMTESNTTDSDINDNSDIFSQLTEMKEIYERKINELHSEFSQLKNLMMAVIRNRTKPVAHRVFQSSLA